MRVEKAIIWIKQMSGIYEKDSKKINPWQHDSYKIKFWFVLVLSTVILSVMPIFFKFVQERSEGRYLNDMLLDFLPAYDCSIPIFILMYSISAYAAYASWHNAWIFFRYITAYVILAFLRAFSIFMVPLIPPKKLVSLTDPFVTLVYGGIEVTKDLMFSGHTASMFLLFLVLPKNKGKWPALVVCIMVAMMLLIQHIHYTIDILVAFPATYFCFWLSGKYISNSQIEEFS